jgi:hypothetical protein
MRTIAKQLTPEEIYQLAVSYGRPSAAAMAAP